MRSKMTSQTDELMRANWSELVGKFQRGSLLPDVVHDGRGSHEGIDDQYSGGRDEVATTAPSVGLSVLPTP